MKTFYWILVMIIWGAFFIVIGDMQPFNTLPNWVVFPVLAVMTFITWALKKIMRV